ncbi:MAG: heavy metal transporter [Gammaproteobacteria bacterium]|nr:MAG: heavy metal transporter [Gammaproteobacteria bacterium]
MQTRIQVENIRCSGCTNTINKKLMAIEGVHNVTIDIDTQTVTIEFKGNDHRDEYITALVAMGYPEKGSVEGLQALKGKAKSVISCAIGKMA